MSSELKRNKCLEQIYHVPYKSMPSIETSGRYIKTLRNIQSLTKDEKEKVKYEYIINKCLHKHIIFLQESIINGYGNTKNTKLDPSIGEKIKRLAKSDYSLVEGNISITDVDGLKKMNMLKKAVILKKPLVLPCKVKSENQKYKFNTQIIMTKNNVLSYASNKLEYDSSVVNHNILLTKVGKGLTAIESNNKTNSVSR